MSAPLKSILIYGCGLALEYTVAHLRRALSSDITLTIIEDEDSVASDSLYGPTMPPVAYDFNRSAGMEEPELVLKTSSSLSYGSHYSNWGRGLDWVQCFNSPLPIWEGVRFHHYVASAGAPLEVFLPGAMAGRAGKFAHPPENSEIILSRAEYGYQYNPSEICALLRSVTQPLALNRSKGQIEHIQTDGDRIINISLKSGATVSADLYIDASGPAGSLISALNDSFKASYPISLMTSTAPASQDGASLRTVEGHDYGWLSKASLRGSVVTHTCTHPSDRSVPLAAHDQDSLTEVSRELGRRDQAWTGNCVAIGQAACGIEPLSAAPFLLLMRDIERLASLIPTSTHPAIESLEYNRRYLADYEHAELFHLAFFQTADLPASSYWQSVQASGVPEKLARKITLFESRGDLVSYDLEPFNDEDWLTLHFGMSRPVAKKNVFLEALGEAAIRNRLISVAKSIEALVPKMPPHGVYISKFQQYLKSR